ncbi:hypothetical protein RFI_28614, partial [Reticulomyxa filosa]
MEKRTRYEQHFLEYLFLWTSKKKTTADHPLFIATPQSKDTNADNEVLRELDACHNNEIPYMLVQEKKKGEGKRKNKIDQIKRRGKKNIHECIYKIKIKRVKEVLKAKEKASTPVPEAATNESWNDKRTTKEAGETNEEKVEETKEGGVGVEVGVEQQPGNSVNISDSDDNSNNNNDNNNSNNNNDNNNSNSNNNNNNNSNNNNNGNNNNNNNNNNISNKITLAL